MRIAAKTTEPVRRWNAVYLRLTDYEDAEIACALDAVEPRQRQWTVPDLAAAVREAIEDARRESVAAICEAAAATAAGMEPITAESHAAYVEDWQARAMERRQEQWDQWRRLEAQRRDQEARLLAARQDALTAAARGTVARAMALGRVEVRIAA